MAKNYNESNLSVGKNYSSQGKPFLVSENRIPLGYNSFYTGILLFFVAVFVVSVLNVGTNPVDLFFGDGMGNGGLLNLFSGYGERTLDFMNRSIDTFKSWGIIDSNNNIFNFFGSVATIITFIVNVLIQTLIFVIQLIIYVISGGRVTL